jgi:hypothetical protein
MSNVTPVDIATMCHSLKTIYEALHITLIIEKKDGTVQLAHTCSEAEFLELLEGVTDTLEQKIGW